MGFLCLQNFFKLSFNIPFGFSPSTHALIFCISLYKKQAVAKWVFSAFPPGD
jgi:hypothetical protein